MLVATADGYLLRYSFSDSGGECTLRKQWSLKTGTEQPLPAIGGAAADGGGAAAAAAVDDNAAGVPAPAAGVSADAGTRAAATTLDAGVPAPGATT